MAKTRKNPLSSTRRHRIRVPKRRELGAPPGTLHTDTRPTTPVRASAFVYDPEGCHHVNVECVEDIAPLRKSGKKVWLNVDGVVDAALLQALGAEFGWHPLALEDVASLHQRPKTEDFGSYVYVVVYMPYGREGLPMEQLSILFGENYVATIQGGAEGDCLEPVRRRMLESRGKARTKDADYLAYAIIDAVVDHYFPLVDRMNTRLERLEQDVLDERAGTVIAEIPAIRSDLHSMWRTLAATREAINLLIGAEIALVSEDTQLYLRDCEDHCAQLLDAVEACRDLSANLLDLNQAIVNNRSSETMRVLTLIATIFMPLSFLAGVYGMNFDREVSPLNMPELGWYAGYPMALGLMACTALGFVAFFWRAGWLRPQNGASRDDKR